jgi:Mrp family chromosome partitioning ATPase
MRDILLPEVVNAYDLILIDSPPSQVLVDARILAPMVNGILYCAKWGATENNSVAMGVKALQNAGGLILGMVLGQVKAGEYKLYETRQGHPNGPYLLHGNA